MTPADGKLPPELLREMLARLPRRDSRVVVGPGIGRDAAVLDVGGRMLVATSDPVTFAADSLGWYAVQVNANDVACMGARPAWMLATALLPEGTTASVVRQLFGDLAAACEALGVELIGGHTEITPGVVRPIVVATMIGEAAPDEIVTGKGIDDGDIVLMTKHVAIEGTALLARDAAAALRARAVPEMVIERARDALFDPGISVVRDAAAIASASKPRMLHDPTEGGIATALHEMAEAAQETLAIDPAAIAVDDDTRLICEALGLDALGLLASGSLLAIVARGDYAAVAEALARAGIACHAIGRVAGRGARAIMDTVDTDVPLVTFGRDELARFFEAEAGRGANTTPEGRSA